MLQLPDFVTAFMNRFIAEEYKIYIVGGTVRGLLMQHEVKDWDFTTTAHPDDILRLFSNSFYNNIFGTVGIPIEYNGESFVFQVTTHRKESEYHNVRHPNIVEWAQTVEEDLARRDFTINAIAYDGKKIIDPYNGQKDIHMKIIRAVGDPEIRFNEDALRLLRAIRQASQLGFDIESKTFASIKKNAKQITQISWERIREEFFKLLISHNAVDGIFLLRNSKLLPYILPEVEDCFGVDQVSPERHHIYDVGTHLVESLRHCSSNDAITRFATLIHDIGKKETYHKDKETGMITFYNHEVIGAKKASEIADRFKLSKDEKNKLVTLVCHHQFTVSESQSDKAIRRFIRQIGEENIGDMLALRTGDRLGSGAKETSWRTELFKKRLIEVQQIPFSVHDLKIRGYDVMEKLKIKPGPHVGKILNILFQEVDDGKLINERKALFERLKSLKKCLNNM